MEIALAKFLERSDFATRQSDRERADGKFLPKFDSRIFAGFDRKFYPIVPYGHAPISMAYRLFGSRVANYKVFSVDRNPWDRAVSTFFWSNRSTDMRTRPEKEQREAFRTYLKKAVSPDWKRKVLGINAHRDISQRRLYCLGDTPVVDVLMRFECLEEDLANLSTELKLPETISVAEISAKTGHRPKTSRTYELFYDDETIELVANAAKWEIERLGYGFHTTPARFVPDPKREAVKFDYINRVCRN